MKISDTMKTIIKESRKLSRVLWTSKITGIHYIGYGHVVPEKELKNYENIKLTKKECEKLFEKDMQGISKSITALLACKEIPQNHFDVFCHILFDLGDSLMLKNSSFFCMYKKGLIQESSKRIMVWSKYKGIYSLTLYNRRKLDYQIFIKNDYNTKKKEEDAWKTLLT